VLLAAAPATVPAWIGAVTAFLGVLVGLGIAWWQLSRQRQGHASRVRWRSIKN